MSLMQWRVETYLKLSGEYPYGFDSVAAHAWLESRLIVVSPAGARHKVCERFTLEGEFVTLEECKAYLRSFRMEIPPDVIAAGPGLEIVYDFVITEWIPCRRRVIDGSGVYA